MLRGRVFRFLIVVACALALLGGLLASPADAGPLTPLDTQPDLDAALAAEARILDHFHYGQVHEQLYNTASRVEGDIATLVGENDSALYTGNYLGGEAFRYALAKRKIAAHGPDEAFWTAQRNDAKSRVDAMVNQFHLLANISGSWQTMFDPHLNQDRGPTENGYIDFGGGVFQGKPGLLFRACNPEGAPAALDVGRDPNRGRLVTHLKWPPDRPDRPIAAGTNPPGFYNCLDGTSRDAYAGTTFGLATALDLVGPDDTVLRNMIARDLMTMTDFTLGYAWGTPRPHGQVVIPELFGGNDLDNFYSPLFMYTPVAQLNMTQMARHAAQVAGTTSEKRKWEAIWKVEYAAQAPHLAYSMELDASSPHDSYYKFHLNYLTLFNLIRIEKDKSARDLFKRAMGVTDATIGDDQNALYDAFTFGVTGEQRRLDDAALHHRQWLEYKQHLDDVSNHVVNSTRCGTDIECVDQMWLDILIPVPGRDNPIVRSKHANTGEKRARYPLPVKDRKGGDFMWQKDPTILDGNESPTWEPPGADFLLPYWMTRYYSEAARPSLSPLPKWYGPYFN